MTSDQVLTPPLPPARGPLSARVQPTIYTVVGDSHAQRFDGLSFESAESPHQLIVAKARWQPCSRASEIFTDGRLNETLTRVFIEMRLTRASKTELQSPFLPLMIYPYPSPDRGERTYYRMRSRTQGAVMLFSYGEYDALDICQELSGHVRFDVHPAIPGLERLADDEGDVETISLELVMERVRARSASLLVGLKALADYGYENLFLHDLPPPSTLRLQQWASARLRYKINVLFNRVYEEFCRSNGIGFVSIWDQITIGGLRDSRYDKDGIHLTPESAILSMCRLQEQLDKRRGVVIGSSGGAV